MGQRLFQFTLRQLLSAMTIVAIACAIICTAIPVASFFMLTGSPFPISKIDRLVSPVSVAGWDSNGLILHGGRTISLPGVHGLPENSSALSEVSKRGVEIASDGRVYGLVKIHHWCGNDPVRTHIVRADIADWLEFLQIGEVTSSQFDDSETVRVPGGSFSEFGWDIGEYYQFRMTMEWLKESNT